MDVHEMLAVVVSDSSRRPSCDLERSSMVTVSPGSDPVTTTSSPFAAAARQSLDMGSAPVTIPRGSLDLPKASNGAGSTTTFSLSRTSLSRMLSGTPFFPSSLSRTSTSTYPSQGSASPPLSPGSTFGGHNTLATSEYGWATSAMADGNRASGPGTQLPPKPKQTVGGLARCLADINHMEPMYHMDAHDFDFDRTST